MTEMMPPALGRYLRAIRTRPTDDNPSGFTRQRLATKVSVSVSYLTQLENGEKDSPTPAVLDAIAQALDLTYAERHHLYDLAGVAPAAVPTEGVPTVEEERAAITADMLAAIDGMAPHLVAYLDNRWNILAANSSYARAFPNLVDAGNVLEWFFAEPAAKKVMIDWESEANLTVAWLRALMGRSTQSWAVDSLAHLAQYEEFREQWSQEHVVLFGRPDPHMHLRDPDTGERYSVNVQVYSVAGKAFPMQIYIGVRIPYCGS